jgi:2-oxoglutarate ferredoxin oxidoreductase subunit gamma
MTEVVETIEAASPATIVPVAATHEANLLGNVRVANVLMLGAYASMRAVVPAESILAGVEATLTGRKAHLLEVNEQAFRRGQELAAPAAA